MAVILGVAWLAAGAPREASQGLCLLMGGTWMLRGGEVARLPLWVWCLAAIWGVGSLLAFLPAGQLPAWREALTVVGLDTGECFTPQLLPAGYGLALQALTGLVFLRLIATRDSGIGRFRLAILIAAMAAACWGLACWLEPGPMGSFGFFANRNHSASLWVACLAVTAGLALEAARRRLRTALCFALAVAVVLLWTLVFAGISRAGFLLGMAGVAGVAGVAALGRGGLPRRIAGLMLAASVVSVVPDSLVKDRVSAKLGQLWGEPTATGRFDARLEIQSDTLRMITSQLWTGWGIGQFEAVFPQYRKLAANVNDGRNLHPESSWLWVAAESGVPAAAALLVLAAVLAWRGVWMLSRAPSRPLRLGFLVAAILLWIHAVVDVPLHHAGLLWFSALCCAAAAPFEGRICGPLARHGWRVSGVGVALSGAWLVHGAVAGRPVTATARAEWHLNRAHALFREGVQSATVAVEGHADPLELAMAELDMAVALTPMDARLHGLRGMLALHFDERDAEARRDFLRQRLLEPSWVRLPLIQAQAWSRIDSRETAELWAEAISRVKARSSIRGADPDSMRRIFREMIPVASGDAGMEDRLIVLAGGDGDLLVQMVDTLPVPSVARIEAVLRSAPERLDPRVEAALNRRLDRVR